MVKYVKPANEASPPQIPPKKKPAPKKAAPAKNEPAPKKRPHRKLSPEVLMKIWNDPNFILPTTKFVLLKFRHEIRTQVKTIKDVIELATKLPNGNMGGLRFIERYSCWAFFANHNDIQKCGLLKFPLIGTWSDAEIHLARDDFLKICDLKNEEMKIKNRPLFIALNILQKALIANAPVPQSLLFADYEDEVELMEPNEAPKN